MDADHWLARQLQKDFDAKSKEKENLRPSSALKPHMSLIDPEWQLIDPTPDIHILFGVFNERFFWGKLNAVEVCWSPRMTSCAGVCVYHGRAGFCSVRLSRPLLIFRPRKDLVETLLHEMIHAYLFVTHNNRDRDGHGPEFHKHMHRINKEAGTHITVYHTFHEEVRHYQQHWWQCDGPCRSTPPFFGMVRRAMNRAPGPNDRWWAQHEATCGGKFIKKKEPENFKKKATKDNELASGGGDIRSFFPVNAQESLSKSSIQKGIFSSTTGTSHRPGSLQSHLPSSSASKKIKADVGSTSSNVFGLKDLGSSSTGFSKPITSSVNNVVGFKDLEISGKKTPASLTPFDGGKGYILGGKKADQNRGGYQGRPRLGGMLSNRGSGTLVLTGKSNSLSVKDISLNVSSNKKGAHQVFLGSGHVLGSKKVPVMKAIPSSKPNVSGSVNSHSLLSKRSSPGLGTENKRLKSELDIIVLSDSDDVTEDNSMIVKCPICNVMVEGEINDHLDKCMNTSTPITKDMHVKSNASSESSANILLLSNVKSSKDSPVMVTCPVCNGQVAEQEINKHLDNACDFFLKQDDIKFDTQEKDNPKCPMCMTEMAACEMDSHVESCAAISLQDISGAFEEDFNDNEEEEKAVGSPSVTVSKSGEPMYPCPCCFQMFGTSEMNDHLDTIH